MASIVNDPGGRRRILFVAPDESRKTIRLGKIDRKSAESIARHVEALLAAKIGGQPVPRDTATWLGTLGEPLRSRLAAVGLVEAQQRRAGVEPWPRLWHSLRASCESDLAQSFPLATVTKWLGNTPSVALRHYVDPTEAAFDRALEWMPKSGAAARRGQRRRSAKCAGSH